MAPRHLQQRRRLPSPPRSAPSHTPAAAAAAAAGAVLLAALLATAPLPCARAATDIAVDWLPGTVPAYNPSLVEHGGQLVSALKRTTFRKRRGKTFWVNSLFMCVGAALPDLRCSPFDPWPEPYPECEFDRRVRDGKTDVTGLGDVKLWAWPGRGVYAIFGRKPRRPPGGGLACTGQVVYDQWLVHVRPEPGAGEWALAAPLRLFINTSAGGFAYPPDAAYIMEKNWMPWSYRGPDGVEKLHVTHMVVPHRVLEVAPSGACTARYETPGRPDLFGRFANVSVHGGPPVVHVPAALAGGGGGGYYLGIMHHIEWLSRQAGGRTRKVKLYRHFAYKTSPQPPFEVTAVSDELPLTFYSNRQHPTKAFIAYVAGLHLQLSPPSNATLLISYGAGDREARVMAMPLAEMEALFTGRVAFAVHDTGPAAAGAGGGA